MGKNKDKFRYDPRPDLTKDHDLWKKVLFAAERFNQNLYGVLHGLRCGGCILTINSQTHSLDFQFSDEFNKEFRQHIKQKYIQPYTKDIKTIFNSIAT